MSDENTTSYWIEPLKGEENYVPWSVQMQDILGELDLLEYVTGETKIPTDEAQLPTWWKND